FRGPDIGKVSNPFAVGSGRCEGAIEHIGSDGGDLPLTQIGRQATPARTSFESLYSHQTLNPMQPTRHSLRQHVVPHPPGAIGPVAGEKAGTNPSAQLFIAPTAPTARSYQPRIEPTPRDTERPAQPFRRPD